MGRRQLLKARKLWRMADLALVAVVLAAAVITAVLLWVPTGGDAVAVIAVGGEEVGRVRLSGVTAGYDLPLHTCLLYTSSRWSWWTDLNPRPADYKSAALPTELHQHNGDVS